LLDVMIGRLNASKPPSIQSVQPTEPQILNAAEASRC